ncbi:MAG TPA: 2,3-bisphosphoglycerate-independent phosphoglycerate mutase [Clostridiales bacterium]|nr:2,3-bisphosphoglycerate-independent phosphoglycerate mutase [Clostridiales bacterium]
MAKLHAIVIMDGFGINPEVKGNAIKSAGTPYIDYLMKTYPTVQIGASGLSVGLPDGQMGNSEVGHTNIGAGRVVYQELTRITLAVQDGSISKNPAIVSAMENARDGKALHLMGLLSSGGVHSHIDHLIGILKAAKEKGVEKVFIHCFMDGRDVSPTSGVGFMKELTDFIKESGSNAKVASITGRFYAMDRDNAWDRVQKAYDMMTLGEGIKESDPVLAMQHSYENGKTDEFVLPTVIVDEKGEAIGKVKQGDSIIFYNFRPDRAREISQAFIYPDFSAFERKTGFLAPKYVSMTSYKAEFEPYLQVAFKPTGLENTFGEYVSKLGLKQLRIAETQKYAHVTFFFNGGNETPYKGEDRVLIPSPQVATFDMKPEMSAPEITDKAIELIESEVYDVMVLNYANCDMVGHTGIMEAAEKAVTTVDNCVNRLVNAILKAGGMAIVTADHGNADVMIAEDGSPMTAHSLNPVPFILVDDRYKGAKLMEGGVLADITPTLLDVMGIDKPAEMTGHSLIERV